MPRLGFILVLLFAICITIATILPTPKTEQGSPDDGASILVAVLGDARRLFANEMFAKADAYFHRGNYPSIFDVNTRREENHMTEAVSSNGKSTATEHEDQETEHEHEEGPPPRDWLERFGRHFHPTVHLHLRDGDEREMLPWLQLSAEMDPHQVESFTVAAYWLRSRLGQTEQAEQFLRDGLRQNPGHPELLNELGRLYFENRKDFAHARNIWKYALRRCQEAAGENKSPDKFLLSEILGGLTRVELAESHYEQAIDYLRQLKNVSPQPKVVQDRIDQVEREMRDTAKP